MAFTPENETEFVDAVVTVEETVEPEPSKTWAIDFENGTIGGFIDGDDALRQYMVKAVMTERLRYVIYSDDYGNELHSLIGADVTPELLNSEIPRMIEEALAYDDRIESVEDVSFTQDGDKLYISFRVVTASGDSVITEEVALNGL